MPGLEIIQTQENFPREDLSDMNAVYVGYFLKHEQSDLSYANFLKSSLRMLHTTGHYALQICNIEVDYSEKEYDAFCAGFAAFEYTAQLIGNRYYDSNIAVIKTKNLFVDGAAIAEFEIADRFTAWKASHANTHSVIVETGIDRGETEKQLSARAIGAEMAWELQSAA